MGKRDFTVYLYLLTRQFFNEKCHQENSATMGLTLMLSLIV